VLLGEKVDSPLFRDKQAFFRSSQESYAIRCLTFYINVVDESIRFFKSLVEHLWIQFKTHAYTRQRHVEGERAYGNAVKL